MFTSLAWHIVLQPFRINARNKCLTSQGTGATEPTPDWRAAGRRPALARGCCWAPSTPSLPAGIWPLRKKSPILLRKKISFRFFFVPPHFLPRSVGTQCGGSTYVAGAVAFTRGVRYILSGAAAHLRSPIIVRLHGAAADQPALRYPDAHPTQMTTRRGPTAGGRIKGGPFLAARFTTLVCVALNLKGGIPKGVVAFCLLSYWRWSPQMRTLSYEMFFFLWGLWI